MSEIYADTYFSLSEEERKSIVEVDVKGKYYQARLLCTRRFGEPYTSRRKDGVWFSCASFDQLYFRDAKYATAFTLMWE